MKTTLDLVDIIWDRLNSSPLKASITGKLYKHRRPVNSQSEDVVINSLPVNNEQLQQAVANVNVHVPNLELQVNGAVDRSQPDHTRLKSLAALAIESLQEVWEDDYTYDVQQQLLIEDPEAGDHYVNIRLEFYNINL